MIFCVLAILMLIASSLLADFDNRDCDDGKNAAKNETSRCSQLTAGAVSFTSFKKSNNSFATLLQFLNPTCTEFMGFKAESGHQ